ncbi:MAG: peptidoglycan DD-metalloendopeptidase family protein [bacterium]|nr:peptidoglycan DD-metalloendopeptidase family protein [bacterium]
MAIFFAGWIAVTAAIPTPVDLKGSIDAKAKELADIQAKKEAVQREIDELTQSGQTLGRDLKVIDRTVTELTYAIKENELTQAQLADEIEGLTGTIADQRELVTAHREALGALIRGLHEAEQEQPLLIFLRHGRFSDGVSDAAQATVLSGKLMSTISDLRVAEQDLTTSITNLEKKQTAREREQVTLASRKTIIASEREGKQQLITATKNREQAYAAQLMDLQKVQDQISIEINKIEEELRRTIDPNTLPTVGRGLLANPVANPKLTQGHGATAFAERAYKSKWHNGVDFGAPIGTEVYAAESGIVINAGDQDAYRGCRKAAYGKFVELKHGNGLTTLYGHLSKIQAKVGTRVERGEVVGYVGRTGYATGPHLHFTVFASQTLTAARPGYPEGTKPSSCGPMPVGGDLDPMKYLP